MELLNVGFDNAVILGRIVSIISVNSTPVKRMIDAARAAGMLVDATRGKKVKSVVITDSNHYIISAIQPETLILRCTQIRERSLRDKKPKDAGKSREKEPEKK
jgi:regulator of extracellular matrix RemA (YlzA/DUF370 family)